MCTVKTCQPKACDDIAMICPDGETSVGRTGELHLQSLALAMSRADDAKVPRRQLRRSHGPELRVQTLWRRRRKSGGACPALAKQCPDGSYVGASGNYEFICPATDCAKIEETAASKLGHHLLEPRLRDRRRLRERGGCRRLRRQCAIPMAKSGGPR